MPKIFIPYSSKYKLDIKVKIKKKNICGVLSISLLSVVALWLSVAFLGSCALNSSSKEKPDKTVFSQIEEIQNRSIDAGNPVYGIVELKKIESEIDDQDINFFLYDAIANWFAMVGDYSESLEYMDRTKENDNSRSAYDKKITEDYIPQDALKYIESVADSNQVIFINEAHHIALHRAFSIRLLKILHAKGFRYFAAETLAPDAGLNQRGYPLMNVSGYYTNEPVYGDLVRTALKLGYTVIPYENEIPCKKPMTAEDIVTLNDDHAGFNWDCQNHREYHQALNLYHRILKKDPAAKIFVHAGYGHIQKKGDENWKPMGVYFQELTGIMPFSIDQQSMREHSAPRFENEIYRYALERFEFTHPIVLQSSKNEILGKKQSEGAYDIVVFHPRTRFIHGRPDWQLLSGSKTHYFLKNINPTGDFPYLISAYFVGETPEAVPIDQIMLPNPDSQSPLILPAGEFVIKVRDKTGKLMETSAVMVKKNGSRFSIVQDLD